MVRCPLRILQIHLFLLVQMHQMLLRGVTPPSYSPGPSRTGLGESGIHRGAEKSSSRKLSICVGNSRKLATVRRKLQTSQKERNKRRGKYSAFASCTSRPSLQIFYETENRRV